MDKHLRDKLDKTKIPYFICIGTMKSMLDSAAPRVGTKLRDLGYKVLGTEDDTIMAKNIHKRLEEEINAIDTNTYQLIYIDATFCIDNPEETTYIVNRPLTPGSGAGKNLPTLGEWFIGINIYDAACEMFGNQIMLLSNTYGKEKVEYLVDLCTVEIISSLEGEESEVYKGTA